MLAALFGYLFIIAILNYAGYASYVPFAIPVLIGIVVWMTNSKEVNEKPIPFMLGIIVSSLYYYIYKVAFAPKDTGTFTYVFMAFVAFMLAIYVMDPKRFGTNVLGMSAVFVGFVIVIAVLSPVFLSLNRYANQETKMSILEGMKESFDQVYYSKADSVSGYIKNLLNALNPNSYVVSPEQQNNRNEQGEVVDPSKEIDKLKDESFIAHLSGAGEKAIFYSSFPAGIGKEGVKKISFILKNEKQYTSIFKYSVGYLIGANLFSKGVMCSNNKPYCLTKQGEVLKPGESEEDSITLNIRTCDVEKGNIYFYKKYISLTKSSKDIDLQDSGNINTKTKASSDPVSIIIGSSVISKDNNKQVMLEVLPYVSKENMWDGRKGYVPYIFVKVPKWLTPISDCSWKKQNENEKEGKVIYYVDLSNSPLCLMPGAMGPSYSCTFSISKEGLGKKGFSVYAVAPYLIKEYKEHKDTTFYWNPTSCSKTGIPLKKMTEEVKKYFDFDEENIEDSGDYLFYVRGAKIKDGASLEEAINDLAKECAELNKNNPAGMKCFSIEFQTPSSNQQEELKERGEVEVLDEVNINRGSVNLEGEMEKNAIIAISNGVFKDKVNIKFTEDSKKKLEPNTMYVLDIYYTSGCNEDTVWVNIYD